MKHRLSKSLTPRVFVYVVPMVLVLSSGAPSLFAQGDAFDFAISEAFIKKLALEDTIEQVVRVTMNSHSDVHPLGSDCEMHIAGTPQSVVLGSPTAIVVEPPNFCKFDPPAALGGSWPAVANQKIINKTCQVTGFPRIFTEHASGPSTASNPNHVFEVHPALSMDCDSQLISFQSFLSAPAGLRAISPMTATSCIQRTLEVRFKHSRYEFRDGPERCGNFAIVEVTNINSDWVREVKGGHSAIARVSADGQSNTTLKLYTLAGSSADAWLAGVKQNGLGLDRKLLHGIFTYDYKSIVKTLRPAATWLKPINWTSVKFPIAFVVFGDTQTVPWEE